jgi:hypothetical protein
MNEKSLKEKLKVDAESLIHVIEKQVETLNQLKFDEIYELCKEIEGNFNKLSNIEQQMKSGISEIPVIHHSQRIYWNRYYFTYSYPDKWSS